MANDHRKEPVIIEEGTIKKNINPPPKNDRPPPPKAQAAPASVESQWEYRIHEGYNILNTVALNNYGEDGWQLVSVVKKEETFYYMFKREKAI